MDKKIMQQLIREAISEKLGGDCQIFIHEVYKTNQKLDALSILPKGRQEGPLIYLNPYYKDLEGNMPLKDIINDILSEYEEIISCPLSFSSIPVSDFSWIKDRLYVQLVNRHLNKEMLRTVPHSLFLDDFAVTVRCSVQDIDDRAASFQVNNQLAQNWNVSSEVLISLAIQNTPKLFWIDLKNMRDYLKMLIPCETFEEGPPFPIWVLTNSEKLYGAACVLFDDVLKSFAEKFGSFYVIFSSVHEVLLIPAQNTKKISKMSYINQCINAEQLAPNEVLGTKAYYYNKDNGFVLHDPADGHIEKIPVTAKFARKDKHT